jgi:hypothetical protein
LLLRSGVYGYAPDRKLVGVFVRFRATDSVLAAGM